MRDLREEYLEFLGREMQESMDFDIVCDTLISLGWTRLDVEYDRVQPWRAVKDWAGLNFEGDHREHAGVWLIENGKGIDPESDNWETDYSPEEAIEYLCGIVRQWRELKIIADRLSDNFENEVQGWFIKLQRFN